MRKKREKEELDKKRKKREWEEIRNMEGRGWGKEKKEFGWISLNVEKRISSSRMRKRKETRMMRNTQEERKENDKEKDE